LLGESAGQKQLMWKTFSLATTRARVPAASPVDPLNHEKRGGFSVCSYHDDRWKKISATSPIV
jgi:hypothetical protein